jgi:nicotinamide mononucleotide transporter
MKPWDRLDHPVVMALLMGCMLMMAYFTSSTPVEIAATTTGLLSVWLTARENLWCWPIGLVNVACFFYMFYDVKLYADMTLQVFFFVLSLYGWYVWVTKRGNAKVRPSTRLKGKEGLILLLVLILAATGWGYLLARYTDASIPYADALIATLSVIAQYLLSRRVVESWYVWIIVDVLSIGMYAYKELYVLAFLYVIFLGIATAGLFSWKQGYRMQQSGEVRD